LRTQAAARFDADGSAHANRLIAELEELRPRLNAARRAALGYAEQRAAADRLTATLDERRTLLAALRSTRARVDALLRAWPTWDALQTARAELATLESIADLPSDAETRLGAARERLGAAQGVAQAVRAEQAELERRVAALPADDAASAVAALVEALHAELPLHRFQLSHVPAARARRVETEQSLRQHLQRAGAEWTVERLRAGAPAIDRDALRDWQARLRAVAERQQQAQSRLAAAAAARAAAARDCAPTAGVIAPQTPSAASVEQRRHALIELRAAIESMQARQRQGEATAEMLHERERIAQRLEATAPPPAWPAALLQAMAGASCVAALWALFVSIPGAALAALVVAAGAVAAAHWLSAARRDDRSAEQQEARRAARSEVEAARRERDAAWRAAAQLAADSARQAAALGLPREPSPADLAALQASLDDAAVAEAGAGEERARLAELERTLHQCIADERARADEVGSAAAERAALEAAWTAWRAAAGFTVPAAPDAVLERVGAVESASAALAALDAAARDVSQIEPIVAAWESRARAALERGGASEAAQLAGDALVERFIALRRSLHEEAPERARRAALRHELREQAVRVAAAEAEVEHCRAELETVLRAAGAADESDLARRRALSERKTALQDAVAEYDRTITEQLGDDADRAELAGATVEMWRQRAAAAAEELAAAEQQLYELEAEAQQAQAVCRGLEDSADVAALELEWAGLMAELGVAVRDWRVLAAAEGLIEDAREVFEDTRQSGVLRSASAAFAVITCGRYERIVQDETGATLVVVGAGGRQQQAAAELSRATTEQLYLSVRLGLAQELAARGIALPLVMDDVLVHFDPERARAMAAVLAGCARQRQVLLFTSQPAMRDLLLQQAGAERVIEL
jgi:uncharacterized protein YhaN